MLLATARETVERFIAKNPAGATLWIGGSVLTDREITDLRTAYLQQRLIHGVGAARQAQTAQERSYVCAGSTPAT